MGYQIMSPKEKWRLILLTLSKDTDNYIWTEFDLGKKL